MGAPGCDDAPYVKIEETDEPKSVTFIYPYYENKDFLKFQFDKIWWEYPHTLSQHICAVVVDDCSPIPASLVLYGSSQPFPIRLFRIEVDIRWNWLAARNIGARAARDGWIVLTDMDHVIPKVTLQSLIYGNHDEKFIYRFSRVEHTGKKIHPHPNSWFMTKEMFWKIGGYDEACSGYYGTDGDYRRRCVATAPILIMTDHLVRYEYVGDSSTTRYKRKQPEDAAVKKMIRARGKNWKPRTLSFPFHEVAL